MRRPRSCTARRPSRAAVPNSRLEPAPSAARCCAVTDIRDSDDARFVRRALIGMALAAAALLLWQLRFVVVLLFGAVLIATIFRAIADLFEKYIRFPSRLAVLASVLLVVGIIGAVVWAIGA